MDLVGGWNDEYVLTSPVSIAILQPAHFDYRIEVPPRNSSWPPLVSVSDLARLQRPPALSSRLRSLGLRSSNSIPSSPSLPFPVSRSPSLPPLLLPTVVTLLSPSLRWARACFEASHSLHTCHPTAISRPPHPDSALAPSFDSSRLFKYRRAKVPVSILSRLSSQSDKVHSTSSSAPMPKSRKTQTSSVPGCTTPPFASTSASIATLAPTQGSRSRVTSIASYTGSTSGQRYTAVVLGGECALHATERCRVVF